MSMRPLPILSAIAFILFVAPTGLARADNKSTVVADCNTAITASAFGGYGVRIVSGGAVPGMQAYVHLLPSTNSKTRGATFVGAFNVKTGAKPADDTRRW
jgi:hypothetical protein